MAKKIKATERFFESWLNKDHYVLGRKLKPFCLYYQHCLEAIQSPVWYGGNIDLSDLEIAVLICKSDFNTLDKLFKKSWFKAFRYYLRKRKTHLKSELKKFDFYLQDYMEPPEIWEKKDQDNGRSGLPTVLSVSARIEMATGWDEKTVWMMPWGKAYWRATAYAKIEGSDIDLIKDEEIEAINQSEE